jgi:hypothetical protein
VTATQVDGKQVVASEQVVSPLPNPDGSGGFLHFKQIVKLLLLDDGSEVFGCVHCEFTGGSYQKIGQHLRVHKPPALNGHRSKLAAPVADVLPEDMTIGELFGQYQRAEALMAQLERLAESRNEWRARAQEAEKKIASLQSIFGNVVR